MFRRKIACWLMVCLTVLLGGTVSAAQGGAAALFVDAGAVEPAAGAQNPPFVTRSRYVRVDPSALFDAAGNARDPSAMPEILLELFPNASFTGVVTQVQTASGATTWTGALKNVAQGYFYLVATDGAFIAHIAAPPGVFEVSSAGDGLYQVIQIDQSKMGEDAPGKLADPGPILNQATVVPNADSGAVIDVMVVYTAAARAAEGSAVAMKARVALAMAETNQAYANAGIAPRLRLVHTEEIAYAESGNIATDLSRLAGTTDGFMDGVHALRNTYGADMVSLIVENGGGYCGMAQAIMATAATAFDVTARSGCMTGYYSFGHEFGHLQGARHDTYVDPTNTPYAYGHGRTHPSAAPTQSWRTVMAYNNACTDLGFNCTRLQYFSNPTKSYFGAPMGVTGVSENYRVLNKTAFTVANFRTTLIGANFNSSFNGSAAGWVPVKGAWGVNPAYYYTEGLAGYFSTARHGGTYGDITYQARLYRTGCSRCANNLIIRGNPAAIDATYLLWKPSYVFEYTNDGYFSVWKLMPGGAAVALKGWTTSTAIVKNGWNLLKVIAVGPVLKFYINNTLVWTGSDAAYKTGAVGFGMYRDTVSTANTFYVDYATLLTTPTAADVRADEVVAPGVEVPGGDVNRAP